jgi:hypothetical protein
VYAGTRRRKLPRLVENSGAESVQAKVHPGLNSLVCLLLWCRWKQRNTCVFDEISPSVSRLILDIRNEATLWCMTSAKGPSGQGLGRVTGVSN